MSSAGADPIAMGAYLALLYPDPPDDGWLVLSSRRPGPGQAFQSLWMPAADHNAFIHQALQRVDTEDVYLNLGVRSPVCQPSPYGRGGSDDVVWLPGLWADFDHAAGQHAQAARLPSPAQLEQFLAQLPCAPTMLVHSGGGTHAYWLFRELWDLRDPAERAQAQTLLIQFQGTLRLWAQQDGWLMDSTHDLARLLRPAGSLNHKSHPAHEVTLRVHNGPRYNPSDIADAPWLAPIPAPASPPPSPTPASPPPSAAHAGVFAAGPLAIVVQGCAWLQHCWYDAATLPEPEWYAMLSLVGRCDDGRALAHQWSAPYPRYNAVETERKLVHALQHGPYTCAVIERDKGGATYCQACPSRGQVTSPIMLTVMPPPSPAQPMPAQPSPPPPVGAPAVHPLRRTKSGSAYPDAGNFDTLFSHYQPWEGALWWDDFAQCAMLGNDPVTDAVISQIAADFGHRFHMSVRGEDQLRRSLYAVAKRTRRDPLYESVTHLQWDGTPRLGTWAAQYLGADPTPANAWIGTALLCGMVARALEPGCMMRLLVILEGPENIGKSWACRILGGQWSRTLSRDVDTTDAMRLLRGCWVMEVPELDSFRRTDEARIKAFVSDTSDTLVPKYANHAETYLRRTVLIGTVNPDGNGYLKGQTGNTRYLPIACGTIDRVGLEHARDQLLAEAVAAVRQGYQWWLESASLGLGEVREARRDGDIYEGVIADWLADPAQRQHPDFVTMEEIFARALQISEPEKWKDRGLQMRIGTIVQRCGWVRFRQKVGRTVRWAYRLTT